MSNEPSEIVIIGVDGLGDENYVQLSAITGQHVVYVRKGEWTLIMRYRLQEIPYVNNESGIIDMVDRIFNRF